MLKQPLAKLLERVEKLWQNEMRPGHYEVLQQHPDWEYGIERAKNEVGSDIRSNQIRVHGAIGIQKEFWAMDLIIAGRFEVHNQQDVQ